MLGQSETLEQWITVTFVRPRRGRAAWWFRCPGWRRDEPCDRLVAKLYQPGTWQRFACRRCWGLVYRSSQESGKYVARYRQMVRAAEEAGIDVGIDLPEEQAVTILKELIEGRPS